MIEHNLFESIDTLTINEGECGVTTQAVTRVMIVCFAEYVYRFATVIDEEVSIVAFYTCIVLIVSITFLDLILTVHF